MHITSASLPVPWLAQCITRLKADWLLKSMGTSAFMALFFFGYFSILRSPIYTVTTMPTTWVDDLITFRPSAFYMYASLWVYTVLVPALQPSFGRLAVYGVGIGTVCATGLLFFVFLPTAVPFASADWFNDPALVVLRELDMTGNACPSLHVASAIFTAICLNRQLSSMGCPRWLKITSWIWCVLIVYSTLAIKQHVMWDALAGLLLGVVCAVLYDKFEQRVLGAKHAA